MPIVRESVSHLFCFLKDQKKAFPSFHVYDKMKPITNYIVGKAIFPKGVKMYTVAERQQIAQTILLQLGGGSNRIKAMLGAYDFSCLEKGVSFRFKMCRKTNYLEISLNGWDLYDLKFGKIKETKLGPKFEIVEEFKDAYAEDLSQIFESVTGLCLTL